MVALIYRCVVKMVQDLGTIMLCHFNNGVLMVNLGGFRLDHTGCMCVHPVTMCISRSIECIYYGRQALHHTALT